MVIFISANSLKNLAEVRGFLKILKREGTAKNIKVLDCTFEPADEPVDYKEWQAENYGKFDKLIERDSSSKQEYFQSHIPGSIYFDLEAAMYPSRFQRYSHYEPDIFENYIQLLGINQTDEIAVYSRGKLGGMLFAARCLVL
uniref:Rhodanese domain-containing protein n=1 Tax=Panagrolaimus sp. JU765 TaxID=591449 RepID=A0AC34QEN6_9BILA